jgi:hypothetical protein
MCFPDAEMSAESVAQQEGATSALATEMNTSFVSLPPEQTSTSSVSAHHEIARLAPESSMSPHCEIVPPTTTSTMSACRKVDQPAPASSSSTSAHNEIVPSALESSMSPHCEIVPPTTTSTMSARRKVDQPAPASMASVSAHHELMPSALASPLDMPSTSAQAAHAVISSTSTKKFPFNNLSSPDDIDNDILPYPVVSVAEKNVKKAEKGSSKFFILTSDEVLAEKKQAVKEKERKEEEKVKRQEAKAKRLELKEQKEKEKQQAQEKKIAKKSKEPQKETKDGSASAEAEYFCIYCNEKYMEPLPAGEDWIQCYSCNNWCHEKCTCRRGRGRFLCDNC